MNSRKIRSISAAIIAVSMTIGFSSAGENAINQALNKAEARLKAIYEEGQFRTEPFGAQWLPDGSGYSVLESSTEGEGRELVQYDCASGERTVLIAGDSLLDRGFPESFRIENYVLSPDAGRILIETNGRTEDGQDRVVDYWILDRKSGNLRQVVTAVDPGRLSGAFSPEGGNILYRQNQNLFVFDLDIGQTKALTNDGAEDEIINGGGNWGLGGDSSWSPDGRWVAHVQIDYRKVRLRPIVDHIEPTYPEVRYVRFARIGTPIPALRPAVVNVETGETVWIDLPGGPGDCYIPWMRWTGGANELILEKRSRGRDARWFLLADIESGEVTTVYTESDPAWIDASRRECLGLEFLEDGREFVLMSEKDGWRHACIISRDSDKETPLTPGDFDIVERVRTDEATGWFYYIASPENATQRYLFRVLLDGSGQIERISPQDQSGTHGYDLSPDAKWAFHTYSTYDSPPVVELISLPDHRVIRTLVDNRALRELIAPEIKQPTEFFKIDIGDGVVMDAWMLKPPGFDPSKKYPVLIFVYGEPHSQTVLDSWGAAQALYHRLIADLGYIVVSMDNRGTSAPKGAAWRRSIFGSLGPLSTEEQAAGIQKLGQMRPYIDMSRIGIWGWSGGGSNTLNAMFRKPGVYHVGIAVAPKPQPHLYNAWFQEIYMRTPEENSEGYAKSAPINFAEGLKGDLLIIHGTGETNTHIQITEGLVDRLIELGKRFDYMAYPNRDHGLSEGAGTPVHMRLLMVRYLIDRLPPGPRER